MNLTLVLSESYEHRKLKVVKQKKKAASQKLLARC